MSRPVYVGVQILVSPHTKWYLRRHPKAGVVADSGPLSLHLGQKRIDAIRALLDRAEEVLETSDLNHAETFIAEETTH